MDHAHWRRLSRLVQDVSELRELGVPRRRAPYLDIRHRARSHPRLRPHRAAARAHDARNVAALLETLRCLDEGLLDLEREAERPDGFERLGWRLVRGFERRAALVARLPFGLDDLYRVLATRYRSPIATVATDRCSGCWRDIPARTERRGGAPGGFFLCPHCGRILLTQVETSRVA